VGFQLIEGRQDNFYHRLSRMIKHNFKVWQCFFALFFINGTSQAIDNYLDGSRAAAMSNCGVAIADLWSVSHNQAGLAFLKNGSFGLCHEQRYLMKELGLNSLVVAIPVRSGTFGGQLNYFGYSKYHEVKGGVAYSLKLSKNLSAGLQLDYFSSYVVSSIRALHQYTFELGLLSKPIENVSLGFHLFNPLPGKYKQNSELLLSTIARLGISYEIRKRVLFCVETQASNTENPIFRFGFEYWANQFLQLRLGVSDEPSSFSFGFGYQWKKYKIGIAFSNHPVLGFTPVFDLERTF
jgi:hypothetical protein